MADNTQRISEIRTILRAGARRVVVDGTTIEYDFEALRAELHELIATDDSLRSQRPVASNIKLTGF